jgi:ACS family hexuronate transporter-like MFS transporter
MNADGQTELLLRKFGWWLTILLAVGSVVSYIDRAVLGVLMQQVRADLALTNTAYGLAVNCFLLAYALFYILGGRLADQFGYRRLIPLTLAVWSLTSAAHSMARGLWSLCALRAMLGAAQGSFYPAAIRGITQWRSGSERAKSIGLLLAGICLGTLITPPVAAWTSLAFGWRIAFLITGLSGLAFLPAWMALHGWMVRKRVLAGETPHGRESGTSGAATPLSTVLGSGKFWCAAGARALSDAAWTFYLFWLPGYFQAVRGFDPKMIGMYLWIPFGVAGVGAVAGPWIAGALAQKGMPAPRARRVVLAGSAACAVVGALAFLADDAGALALVCLALMAHQSWSANIHTVITEISPPAHSAILYGITGAAGTLAGAIAQPVIGAVVDRRGYAPPFLAAGSCYVAAIVLVLLGVRTMDVITAGRPARELKTGTSA